MPRTIEHISDMHRVATERRNAGRSVWDANLPLKQHLTDDAADDFDGPGFIATRDAIVSTIRAHAWFTEADEFDTLRGVVEGLEDSGDTDEFNQWLDELYDLADHDRIWIG